MNWRPDGLQVKFMFQYKLFEQRENIRLGTSKLLCEATIETLSVSEVFIHAQDRLDSDYYFEELELENTSSTYGLGIMSVLTYRFPRYGIYLLYSYYYFYIYIYIIGCLINVSTNKLLEGQVMENEEQIFIDYNL